MELWRIPATATIITFPILNSSGVATSGAASLDSEWVAWSDAAGPTANGNPGFQDMAGETAEIAASGVYTLAVAATELPAASPYVLIRVASSLATQYVLISTATPYVDVQRWRGSSPLVLASGRVDTTVGVLQTGVIQTGSFTAGAIDAAALAANAIGASEIANDAITAAKIADGAIDANTFAANAIAAAGIAADAFTAAKFAVDVGSEFADALLKRNVASGSTGGREVREALAPARNRVEITAGTINVYDTDDTTVLWTGTVATVSYSAQVVEINPA